jgi:cytoskeleton protein RodZ
MMNHDESMQLTDQGQGEHPFTSRDSGEDPSETTTSEIDALGFRSEAVAEEATQPSFGDRLRASRERHGLSLQDCAQALHLPIRLLEKLEADNYEGIDYTVYLKGYLKKYAAHVRLEESHVDAQLETLSPRQPELVAPPSMPAWRLGIHRYSNAFVYIVLTAVIVVPLVWLGLNGVLKRDIARLAPLNATPVSAQSTELADSSGSTVETPASTAQASPGSRQSATKPQRTEQKPLMASIAPFSAMESGKTAVNASTPVPPQQPAKKTPVVAAATHLALTLQQPSWVEITTAAGKHLEYALLPAGTHRVYDSGQALNVRIGNASGASVQVDGKPLALDRFRNANVAHFDIDNNGSVQPDNS